MPAMVNIHRLHPEHWQDARVEELDRHARRAGGSHLRSVDAEYIVKVDVAGAPRDAHQIEITLDNERFSWTTVGENGRGGRAGQAGRRAPAGIPIPMKAGPRQVGVTFIEHTQARDEETLRPRMRARDAAGARERHHQRSV